MDKKMIAVTANGLEVYAEQDLYEKHMAAHADVKLSDIAEAIKKIDYNGQFGMLTIDLEREIGVDSCVEVTESDAVRHLYRKDRKGKTPCLLNRKGNPTSCITIGICKDDDGLNTLFTAFYGKLAPKEPWDCSTETEKAESENFWKTHALCVDSDAIDWEMSLVRDIESYNLDGWGFVLSERKMSIGGLVAMEEYRKGGIKVCYFDGELTSVKIQGKEIASQDSYTDEVEILDRAAKGLWAAFVSGVMQAKAFINSDDEVEEVDIKGNSNIVILKDLHAIEPVSNEDGCFDMTSLISACDLLGGIDGVQKNEGVIYFLISGKKWEVRF